MNALSAIISAKFDAAEADWWNAQMEVEVLKTAPPTEYPPGINGTYAQLLEAF